MQCNSFFDFDADLWHFKLGDGRKKLQVSLEKPEDCQGEYSDLISSISQMLSNLLFVLADIISAV